MPAVAAICTLRLGRFLVEHVGKGPKDHVGRAIDAGFRWNTAFEGARDRVKPPQVPAMKPTTRMAAAQNLQICIALV